MVCPQASSYAEVLSINPRLGQRQTSYILRVGVYPDRHPEASDRQADLIDPKRN